MAAQGAIGHLCGRFLKADGALMEPAHGPFLLGKGADGLQRIPQRIAVTLLRIDVDCKGHQGIRNGDHHHRRA